jgi:hypothetical protein
MLEQSTKIFRSLPRHTFLRGSSNDRLWHIATCSPETDVGRFRAIADIANRSPGRIYEFRQRASSDWRPRGFSRGWRDHFPARLCRGFVCCAASDRHRSRLRALQENFECADIEPLELRRCGGGYDTLPACELHYAALCRRHLVMLVSDSDVASRRAAICLASAALNSGLIFRVLFSSRL